MEKPLPPEDLWVALDKARAEALTQNLGDAAHPGDGWFSIKEYAERYKARRTSAAYQLERMHEMGKLETSFFTVLAPRKGAFPSRMRMRFYRLASNGKPRS